MRSSVAIPPWLAGPSERRLCDISTNIVSRAPYSSDFAASILTDVSALRALATNFLRCANVYSSPILRLSPELIHEIFAHVAELEPTQPDNIGWIRLGHVGHAFREALLSMRGLWASAVCDVASRARSEVLARAGCTPLSIHITDDDKDIGKDLIEFAMGKISAARSIKIQEHDPDNVLWTLEPRAVSGRELPLLENLHVEAIHRPERDSSWLATALYGVQPPYAPRLRSVVLVNIFIPFPPENLTKLNLRRSKHYSHLDIPDQEAILSSPEQLLGLLRRCVRLERLLLQHIIPDIVPLSSGSMKTIHLPHIICASFNSPMQRIAALLSHLVLPPDATLTLRPDYIDFTFQEECGGYTDRRRLTFLPLFLEHARLGNCSHMAGLLFEVSSKLFKTQCAFFRRKPRLTATIWEGLPTNNASKELHAYAPGIDVCFHQCIWDDAASLKEFITSIPVSLLSRVEAAEVNNNGIRYSDLQLLLSRLPHLDTLILRKPESPSLLSILSHAAPGQPGTRRLNLRDLRLIDVHLCSIPRADKSQGQVICMQEVLDALAARDKNGLPRLRSLSIDGIHLVEMDQVELGIFTARLQEVVSNVRVVA